MIFRTMLRLPTPGYPQDMDTGNPVLDAHLRRVDHELVGARSVRRSYLREVADNLLESVESRVASGADPMHAAHEAVADFGDPAEFGREQRQAGARTFRKGSLTLGAIFGLLMFVFYSLGAWPFEGTGRRALMLGTQALFFGLVMGWIQAYGWDPRPTPSGTAGPRAHPEGADQGSFTVITPPSSIVAAVLLLVIMGGTALLGALALMDRGPFGELAVAPAIFLLLMALYGTSPILGAFHRIEVGADSLVVRSPLRVVQVPWAALRSVHIREDGFAALLPPPGPKVTLCWADGAGGERRLRIPLNGEQREVHRFVARLEREAGVGRSAEPA